MKTRKNKGTFKLYSNGAFSIQKYKLLIKNHKNSELFCSKNALNAESVIFYFKNIKTLKKRTGLTYLSRFVYLFNVEIPFQCNKSVS